MEENKQSLTLDQLVSSVSQTTYLTKSDQSIFYKLGYYLSGISDWYAELRKKWPLLFYSLKRIFFAIITLYAAIIVVYCMLSIVVKDSNLMSDIKEAMNKNQWFPGTEKYEEILQSRKKMLGLDGTLLQQVLIYLRNVTPFIPKSVNVNPGLNPETGEILTNFETRFIFFGLTLNLIGSIAARTEVSNIFKTAMPISFLVGTIATFLSYLVGIPLGIYSAIKKDKPQDNTINIISLVLIALPALIIIKIIYEIGIASGAGTGWERGGLLTKIFPILALVVFTSPGIIVGTRRFVVDEMTSDYKKFASSKGLGEKYIFFVHVFRNSFIRMARSIPAVLIGSIFGSSLLVERTWDIKGMSFYMVAAMNSNDLFTIMAIVVISAIAGIVTALLGDLLLALLDPRIKLA